MYYNLYGNSVHGDPVLDNGVAVWLEHEVFVLADADQAGEPNRADKTSNKYPELFSYLCFKYLKCFNLPSASLSLSLALSIYFFAISLTHIYSTHTSLQNLTSSPRRRPRLCRTWPGPAGRRRTTACLPSHPWEEE